MKLLVSNFLVTSDEDSLLQMNSYTELQYAKQEKADCSS